MRSDTSFAVRLALLLAAALLGTVLGVLEGTAASLLRLLHLNAGTRLAVLGLELLHLVKVLVDEAESSCHVPSPCHPAPSSLPALQNIFEQSKALLG